MSSSINITPLTNYTASDPVTGMFQAVNTMSNNVFGIMLLLGIYFITFSVALKYGTKTAFATSAFLGVIFAIILRLLSLIPEMFLFGAFVVGTIAVVMLWFNRD